MTVGIWVLLAALLAVAIIGAAMRARAGVVREMPGDADGPGAGAATSTDDTAAALHAAGVRPGRVTVVRFTAPWCGRCPAVARTSAAARARLADPGSVDDLALDLDAHGDLAARLGVRALPTTFLVDARTAVRHRISDAPAPDALADTLTGLLGETV